MPDSRDGNRRESQPAPCTCGATLPYLSDFQCALVVLHGAAYRDRNLKWSGQVWRAWNPVLRKTVDEAAETVRAVAYEVARQRQRRRPTSKTVDNIVYYLKLATFRPKET